MKLISTWWERRGRPAVRTAFPAFVTGYDHKRREATVQPTIKRRISDGRPVKDAPPLQGRPVVQVARGGGWLISHGLQKGDQVLVICADRALDTWQPSKGDETVTPDAMRYHDVSDSVILPGLSARKAAPAEGAADELYLGREDGSTSIRLAPGGAVTVTNKYGTIEIDAAGGITLSPGPGQNTKLGGDGSNRRFAMNAELLKALAGLVGVFEVAPEITKPTADALKGWLQGLAGILIGSPNGRDT